MLKKRVTNQSGFTLLEILIAMGILAAMAGMISEVLNGVVLAKNRTEENARLTHAINVGLSKIYDDFNMAFLTDATFQGKQGAFVTAFVGEEESVDFSTMSHVHYVKNARDSDQVSVGYSLRRNDEGMTNLMRRESDFLGEKIDEGGAAFVLIPNLKTFSFSYYDSNEKSWKGDWDTDSVTSAGRLPYMVKIVMTVYGNVVDAEGGERREHDYEIVVPVPMYNSKISF